MLFDFVEFNFTKLCKSECCALLASLLAEPARCVSSLLKIDGQFGRPQREIIVCLLSFSAAQRPAAERRFSRAAAVAARENPPTRPHHVSSPAPPLLLALLLGAFFFCIAILLLGLVFEHNSIPNSGSHRYPFHGLREGIINP